MADLKIYITLAAGVTAASAAFAVHKYNKSGAFCFQFDDASKGMVVADTQWDNYTFTDGCGNNKNYRGSVGMNRGTGVPGSDDYSSTVYNGTDLVNFINRGHDIENHSYYHTGNTDSPPTIDDYNACLNNIILEDDVINRYTAYWCRGFIIPTNYTGFDIQLQAINATGQQHNKYLSCVSQGMTPFYDGQGSAGGTILQGVLPDDVNSVPDFIRLTRFWVQSDLWTMDNMAQYKSAFDDVVAGSKNIMILFTHSALGNNGELPAFIDYFNYLRTQANDSILFAPLREVTEYAQMRKVPLSQSLDGNVLTLTIDDADINHFQRWRDCSFNITADAAITSVAVEGFDSFSYNPVSNLVNAFKQKTAWRPAPSPRVPDSSQTIFVQHGRLTA